MRETATSVSLHEGTTLKTFDAEVTNQLGRPLAGVEVTFVLEGEGSLAADDPVLTFGSRTDGLGRAPISFVRPAGAEGRLAGCLRAQCELDMAEIRLHLISIKRLVRS